MLLGSSKEASARTKMGLRLSGFYRSPSSSTSASSVDLTAQLDRSPRPSRRSFLSGRSALSSPFTSASNSTRTSPASSRNASKTDLAGYFSGATSITETPRTALHVKMGRGGGQSSLPAAVAAAAGTPERAAAAAHEHTSNSPAVVVG